MLYYIDKSCAELLDLGDADAIEFLEQLILHRKKCKNLVIAERSVLHDLSKSEKLSQVVRNYCRILKNRSSEFRMILSESRRYYKVVSAYEGDKIVENNGQIIIHLSMKEGNQTDFTDRCVLLAESTDDIEFYKLIGSYYLKTCCVNHMSISFEEMIGGGDTISRMLECILDENQRQCLCIIDSDKKYPGADCGNTLQKAADIIKRKGTEHAELCPLYVHEIENLIPVGMLDEICINMPDTKTGIAFLKFLLDKDSSENSPVFYFDYKKGIPKDKFILKDNPDKDYQKKFRRSENYRSYWKQYIEAYGKKLEASSSDPVIPGVCEKILKYAIQYLKKDIQTKIEVGAKKNYIQNLWIALGAVIVTWGCVGNRIAA